MDTIASWQTEPQVRNHPELRKIQFWTLEVDLEKRKGLVRCDWDEGKPVVEQEIPYTDFPWESRRVWVQPHHEPRNEAGRVKWRQVGWIAHLPSEY